MNSNIAIKMNSGPSIMLSSGSWFDLLDPQNSEFTIFDIAHGLSNICRYSGQCSRFYSVAEHSLYVCEVSDKFKLEALLHDAAEAFIGDITGPLKQLLPQYKEIEKNIENAIAHKFNLCLAAKTTTKVADLRVLAAEQAQIMPRGTDFWASPSRTAPADITVEFLSPSESKERFLRKFFELSAKCGKSVW